MRYCGNCGLMLYPASIAAGHCLSCGAPITEEGAQPTPSQAEWFAQHGADPIEPDYRTTQMTPMSLPSSPQVASAPASPSRTALTLTTSISRRRLGFAGLGLAVLLTILLVVFVITTGNGELRGSGTVGVIAPPQGTTTASKHTPVAGNTPLPGIGGIAGATATLPPGTTATPSSLTPIPGIGGTSTPPPDATVTPAPTNTPTPTPIPSSPASMTISPANFSSLVCLNASATFTIKNNGGSTLNWVASSSNSGYAISPKQDALASGAQEQVSVHSIGGSGTITFTDPNAANSPQQVTISCSL